MSDQLLVTGKVIEDMGNGAYRVELSNGHRCVGRAEKSSPPLNLEESVQMSFHPYDLSRGRIISPKVTGSAGT